MRIRIATYNIHGCVGTDGRFDVDRVVRVLRELDADIVALQEVEYHDVDGIDLLEHLAGRSSLTPIAGPTMFKPRRAYGNAILTRLPVTAVRPVDISQPGREPRGALDVDFACKGVSCRVIATHLGLLPGERRIQINTLLPLFDEHPADVAVLLGDLNEWLLWGRPLRWLHRRFSPTPHLRTFPSRLPLFALDRIWVSPATCLQQIETHDTPAAKTASDHLPLKAVLDMPAALRTPDQALCE
jgi:endonuclease/exonuclease/phosphatase family metal-dependent hydrolase